MKFSIGTIVALLAVSAQAASHAKTTSSSSTAQTTTSSSSLQAEGCMQTNWEDAGNKQNLVCTAKEVFLNSVTAPSDLSCDSGSMITVSLTASIHFNTARFDPGWYVSLDGGDALRGSCAINGLVQGNYYAVSDGKGTAVGRVAWDQDFKGGNDQCGDVLITGGGGCDIQVPFIDNAVMPCVDTNNDGKLDFAVCFSWRVPGRDDYCTLSRSDPSTKGNEADLYPGTPSKCFCDRYDVATITVNNVG